MSRARRSLPVFLAALSAAGVAVLATVLPEGEPIAGVQVPARAHRATAEEAGERSGAGAAGTSRAVRGARAAAVAEAVRSPAAAQSPLLEGRLIDRLGRGGIGGAEVLVAAGERTFAAASAADGTFAVALGEEGGATLEVRHPAYVDLRRARADLESGAVIELERSGAIRGRVVPRGDVEVEGARLALWSASKERYRGEPVLEVRVEDGRFAFEDLGPGTYGLSVHARGAALLFETGIAVSPGEERDLVLPLDADPPLAGRVLVGGSREPVAGAVVVAWPALDGAGGDVESRATEEVRTEPDGSFRLSVPGRARVEVRTPWGSRSRADLDPAKAGGPEHRVVVPGPAHLSGRAVTAGGRGVPAARVVLALACDAPDVAWLSGAPEGLRTVVADGEGRFDLGAVPSGERLQLAAYAGGDVGLGAPLELREGEVRTGFEVPVTARGALEVRASSAAGAPVTGADVTVEMRIARQGWAELARGTTDGAGRVRFETLLAADLRVEASCPGFAEARGRALLAPGRAATEGCEVVELVLERRGSLAGLVVDAEGWAVPGARVIARTGEGDDERRRAELADAFGRFTIGGLDDGEWTLSAWAEGHRLPDGGEVRATLPGAASVALVLEPVPVVAPATVTGEIALRGNGLPVEGLCIEGARRAAVAFEGARFRVTGLRPGRARLVARAPGVESVLLPAVDLAPGVEVELGRYETRRTARVDVEVVDPAGEPVSGARVRLVRALEVLPEDLVVPRKIELESASGGRYRAAEVGRYPWRLEVRHRGFAKHVSELRVDRTREHVLVALAAEASARAKSGPSSGPGSTR